MPNPPIHFAHHLLHARDWQHRPEFDQLCDWWVERRAGVCALVGIGGAGKTAVAERFLQELPDVLPEAPDIPKNSDLPTPEGLFAFSFYDVPNPDSFFGELAAWLTSSPFDESAKPPSYQQTLMLLAQAGSCLLVLDGLEKVQNDDARRGIFGQIEDRRLSDLVLRVAAGYLPNIRTIITTRFQIAELEEKSPPHYFPVPVEEISDETGIALLRKRGVAGPDVELQRIVHECGNHALTVDLVGGYIADLGGNPKLKLGTSAQLKRAVQKEPNARRRRVLLQEYKFARIAERYRQAFAKKDRAALALLERVCLFRLAVDAKTLASIFIGKGKAGISGLPLARLSKEKLQARLDLLVELRLLETTKRETDKPDPPVQYVVHPAIRDGFLKGLDAEVTQRGHEAASEGLTQSLGGLPGTGTNPSDPAVLDLLEEIIHHTLAAGHMEEAWHFYEGRIGHYENLGHRLGAYERGERICRAFTGGQSPEIAPLPDGLSGNSQAVFINEWALYLSELGQLEPAAHCLERYNGICRRNEDWAWASIGHQNFAKVLLSAGRLKNGLLVSEEALRLAEFAEDSGGRSDSHCYRASARGLRGQTDAALEDFRNALHWQHEAEGKTDRPLYSLGGISHTQLLNRLGDNEEAVELTNENKRILVEVAGPRNYQEPPCNLLLADLARERSDFAYARRLLEQAHEWAIARDAKEPLCWSALVRARIALDAGERKAEKQQEKREELFEEARASIEESLHIARDCGYGIFHIDLLLLRARLALNEGDPVNATDDIIVALEKGVHPKKESGLPTLLAATDPECGYAWGIAEGHHLLAETRLLKAAQKLGKADFALAKYDSLPANVKKLIKDARKEIDKCLEIRKRIKDAKLSETEKVIKQLDGGVLTEYPLQPVRTRTAVKPVVQPEVKKEKPKATRKRKKEVAKKHVFLSYCHENTDDVAKLRDDLIAEGETVWWDQDILTGQDIDLTIRQAMKDSYAVILCMSKEAEARTASGIFPEALDAIGLYRQYKPQSVFLIPVRLSKCGIPLLKINATTTLNDLKYMDLFPPSKRDDGLQELIKALRVAPLHP